MKLELTVLPFQGVAQRDLDHLVEDLAVLGVHAQVRAAVAVPDDAYDPQRRQYLADTLLRPARHIGADLPVLAVTDRDLYAEGLNFVFGLAESPGRAAVISFNRLRYHADDATFRARAVKEAMHELGHVLGLGHCPDPACVMHFSNSLVDTDRKGRTLCPRCRAQHLLPV
jgi:archaemetzincin